MIKVGLAPSIFEVLIPIPCPLPFDVIAMLLHHLVYSKGVVVKLVML
jgi:hypothetical protein